MTVPEYLFVMAGSVLFGIIVVFMGGPAWAAGMMAMLSFHLFRIELKADKRGVL